VIVVDASALLEFLLQTSIGVRVEARLFRDADELQRPTWWMLKSFKASDDWCGWVRSPPGVPTKLSWISPTSISTVIRMSIYWCRAWKLRDNVSAYDAMYVALAEAIEATIVTATIR
jgi:predicted nucleic acid-binding protein